MVKKFLISIALVLVATATMAYYTGTQVPDAYTGATEQIDAAPKIKLSKLVGQWSEPHGVAVYDTEDNLVESGGEATIAAVSQMVDRIIEAMEVRDMMVDFTNEGIVSATVKGNTMDAAYTIDGSSLQITSNGKTYAFQVQIDNQNLSIYYPLSKCPQQIRQYFYSIPIEGLSVGIQFHRQ